MLAIIVEFTVDPACRAAFLALLTENARRSVEREPGCLQFDIAADPGSGERILLYEIYADRASFEAHLRSGHFIAFARASEPLVHSKQVREFRLDWSNIHETAEKVRENAG